MKIRLETFILLFLLALLPASAFCSTWAKSYGSRAPEFAQSIQVTSDNGFIVAGHIEEISTGFEDASVLKLDANGNVIWHKIYGGPHRDEASSIQETSDHGFIVAGYTRSFGAGLRDAWVLKLDANGDVVWQKAYGGSGGDVAYSIQETSDNGFIVTGFTSSGGVWLLKLDANGNIDWQKAYGSGEASSIQQTSDNGFIVASSTSSFSSSRFSDYWILKLDANGNVVWQKAYGSSFDDSNDIVGSIQETSDNGFIVAGYTSMPSSDLTQFLSRVLKLDANGNVVWQKTHGRGDDCARTHSIQETSDNGFITTGYERWYDDPSGLWVLKLDANGNDVWQKTYSSGIARSIQKTSDNGFIVAGYTGFFGAGSSDYWVLKLDANGSIPNCDLFEDASVVINEKNLIAIDSAATVSNTSVTVTTTAVTPIDTDATVEEQCFYPSITVDSPNGGENLFAGGTYKITWTSEGNIDFVTIKYSANNGTDWTEIIASTANDGSYDWVVPRENSDECLVKISDVDTDISDISDNAFSIKRKFPWVIFYPAFTIRKDKQ
jgi:hypothetical protein